MKKILIAAFILLVVATALPGARVGRTFVAPPAGEEFRVFAAPPLPYPLRLFAGVAGEAIYFSAEIARGNLRLQRVQEGPLPGMEQHRFRQHHAGLEVIGGEIIQHLQAGVLREIEGEYFLPAEMDPIPALSGGQAADLFRQALNDRELQLAGNGPELVIYPVGDDDLRLAYRVNLARGEAFDVVGIIDARSGEVLLAYSNVRSESLTIGTGLGVHGEKLKLSTNYRNGKYWLMDEARNRPVKHYTFHKVANQVLTDSDNDWEQDRASNSVHAYMGLTYHYYYQVFGRKGLDNKNLPIKAIVHYPGGTDNAFWNGNTLMMYFLDPGKYKFQTAAALDVIAHEYSHGVTQFTSDLIYANESGALNEAFSDIMGTAVEFQWQPAGSGFCQADYYMGEDIFSNYGYALRNLVNPNLGGDPCHLTQKKNLPNTEAGDWGGVHINCTIYGHAYYLLANGGTNPLSGMAVTGIGVDKATKIYYLAFTGYLTPGARFIDAANAILKAATNLFGSSSNEMQQAVKSMQAIGWTVN
ncbi:MAG: M4 family metallopeptidase [Acidobacteria bacterium]|jgi:thermolysin|nr:M4 family metallopeptidase [Acidobacteriota bacterium]